MTDSLNDPGFPDRPTHPDFWRIAQVLTMNDGKATEGGQSIPEITAATVHIESLAYVARQRALMALTQSDLPILQTDLVTFLTGFWIDGFVAGATFQQEGGHQHD